MPERRDPNNQANQSQLKVEFIPVSERPVALGLADLHDDRPVATEVRAGGDPDARIVPDRYPARG